MISDGHGKCILHMSATTANEFKVALSEKEARTAFTRAWMRLLDLSVDILSILKVFRWEMSSLDNRWLTRYMDLHTRPMAIGRFLHDQSLRLLPVLFYFTRSVIRPNLRYPRNTLHLLLSDALQELHHCSAVLMLHLVANAPRSNCNPGAAFELLSILRALLESPSSRWWARLKPLEVARNIHLNRALDTYAIYWGTRANSTGRKALSSISIPVWWLLLKSPP